MFYLLSLLKLNLVSVLVWFFCVECWQAWALVNEANLGDLFLTLENGTCISIVFVWFVDLICLVLLPKI